MARKDPEEERRRRAREDLDKGLRRNDLEMALAAAQKLREGIPAPSLERLGVATRRTITEAHRAAGWARLHTMAVTALEVPGLLDAGAPAGSADAARWSLFWGCVRSRDFRRAQAMLNALEPQLADEDRLLRCLREIVSTQGAPSEAVLAALPDAIRAGPDPRLGHDLPRPRPAALPCPTDPAGAREALYLALATRPFAEFATLVERWLAEAKPELSQSMATVAGELARRELIRRARAHSRLDEPVRLMLHLLQRWPAIVGGPTGLVDALRIVIAHGRALEQLEGDPHGLTALCRVLLRDPQWGKVLSAFLADAAGKVTPTAGGKRFLETWLDAREGDLEAWTAVAGRLAATPEDRDEPLPDWLWSHLGRALALEPALGRRLCTMPEDRRMQLISLIREEAPLAIGLSFVERAWPSADDETRKALTSVVMALSEEGVEHDLSGIDDELEDPSAARSMKDMARRMLNSTVKAPLRAFWERLGPELLEQDGRLLGMAIAAGGGGLAERKAFVLGYLARHDTIEAWIDAVLGVAAAGIEHAERLCDDLFEQLLRRFAADPEALARGLMRAERRAAPPHAVRLLAEALRAAAPKRVADRSLLVREALALARALLKGKARSGRKPTKKRTTRKKSRSPEGDGEEPPPKQQLEIPF